jgi:hypothetical protein
MKTVTAWRATIIVLLCLSLLPGPALSELGAQQAVPQGAPPQGPTGQDEETPLRPEELDQLLAPIALYPDDLVAQVLTASTYPVEVVQAARFAKENSSLKGEQLLAATKDKDWDPSVKAMLQFPDVLAMMDEKLDWTTKLGNAFLAQERDVMDAVQRLRVRANEAGNLKTTQEQKVIVEQQTQTIIIQPANPQVVYVPTYNPVVVYGAWPYPAYPPYRVYPPGYVAGVSLFSFGVGVAVGAAWGGWGGWGCNWRGGDVNINVNRYNSFTRNNYVNANRYQLSGNVRNQTWQHNPEHRRGAQYRNTATAQRYGENRAGTRETRSGYRGYEGGAGARAQTRAPAAGGRAQTRAPAAGGGAETRERGRPGEAGAGTRPAPSGTRQAPSGARASAFSGAASGGGERAASMRGQASRGSASTRSAGATRGGGGTARGGGGRTGGRR